MLVKEISQLIEPSAPGETACLTDRPEGHAWVNETPSPEAMIFPSRDGERGARPVPSQRRSPEAPGDFADTLFVCPSSDR